MSDAAYWREYRRQNPEKVRRIGARYRARNPERQQERHAKYYAANRERILADRKEYGDEYRATHREELRIKCAAQYKLKRAVRLTAAKAYRQAHPQRIRAQAEVRRAIRAGRLVRGPCSVCGLGKAHAHHADYSEPLDVTWLCASHHQLWHQERSEAAA